MKYSSYSVFEHNDARHNFSFPLLLIYPQCGIHCYVNMAALVTYRMIYIKCSSYSVFFSIISRFVVSSSDYKIIILEKFTASVNGVALVTSVCV